MNTLKSIVALSVGGGLAVVAGAEAFAAAGLEPNLRLVFGWSLLLILGLYLVGWGLMTYVTGTETDAGSGGRVTAREPALDTRPSAGSNAKRSGPSNSWYDSER